MERIQQVIFDWKRTLYDPDNQVLVGGALELLAFLQTQGVPMVLIGKGGEEMMLEMERLGVKDFFNEIIFVPGEKNPEVYAPFIPDDHAEEVVVVGDRVRSELLVGNSLGATTVWVRQGKFASEEPLEEAQVPTHTVENLDEVMGLLITLLWQ